MCLCDSKAAQTHHFFYRSSLPFWVLYSVLFCLIFLSTKFAKRQSINNKYSLNNYTLRLQGSLETPQSLSVADCPHLLWVQSLNQSIAMYSRKHCISNGTFQTKHIVVLKKRLPLLKPADLKTLHEMDRLYLYSPAYLQPARTP